jgi:hypothetical protein
MPTTLSSRHKVECVKLGTGYFMANWRRLYMIFEQGKESGEEAKEREVDETKTSPKM